MGVIGIYGVRNASTLIYYGLHNLQHRGQEGAGMAVFTEDGQCRRHRGLGLVNKVFCPTTIESLEGKIGIGAVCYANASKAALDNVQPIFFHHKNGDFAIAGDGNIVNGRQIAEYLEKKGIIFQTATDGELLAHLIKKHHDDESRIDNIVNALNMMEGGFSFLIMTRKRIYACRAL